MTEVVATQTPPILRGPSEKERKYDRQLRLWAANGQAALESAHILLVNSGCGIVGIETLKNLVLPGIGHFTIVDDARVAEPDLGMNFFLSEDCLGRSRAECCAEMLLELNPDVKGDWYPKEDMPFDLEKLLQGSPTFTMVLCSLPIAPKNLAVVESYVKEHKTPLLTTHSAGFYSYFNINLPGAFPIIDTHPDETATTDLRLLRPWDELVTFCSSLTKDIDALDGHEHAHIPFVAILLHYLDAWKKDHGGLYPQTYNEKVAFRSIVSQAARTNSPEGGEENFEEAAAAVLKAVVDPSLPQEVKEVFDFKLANSDTSSSFWIIASALKIFYQKHGCLPVPGNLPDMKATSEAYIRLQNIYKAKARQDAAEVIDLVQATPGGQEIDPREVELFCKNAAFVKLIKGRTQDPTRLGELAELEFANDEMAAEGAMPFSLLPIYLALRGASDISAATSTDILRAIAAFLPSVVDNKRVEQAAEEVCRAGKGELHNVSAVTGGMIAQEIIKIITKQYIPIENTCIFDGIGSRCQVFRL